MKELTLKESQEASLQVLKEIHRICVENNIKYSLAFGTLIGAIRHKGFIPWDDDIDIIMPRPDYDLFLLYMKNNAQKERVKIFNRHNTPNYPYGITRVCDTNYIIRTHNVEDCGMGIFVDVYPFDGIGTEIEEAKRLMNNASNISSIICVAHRKKFERPAGWSPINIWKSYKSFKYVHSIGIDYYFNELEKIINNLDYSNSTLTGCPSWAFYKCIYKKEWLEDLTIASFEGAMFSISSYYDEMLRTVYGDYMKLPKVKDRIPHHDYKVYKK